MLRLPIASVAVLLAAALLSTLYIAHQSFGGTSHTSFTKIRAQWRDPIKRYAPSRQHAKESSLPAPWHIHHVFNGTSDRESRQCDECPPQWPAGLQLWDTHMVQSFDNSGSAATASYYTGNQSLAELATSLISSNNTKGFKDGSMLDNADTIKGDAGRGKALPLTLEALQYLWKHQHPANCSNEKILVYEAVRSGIGSVLHVLSAALRAGLDSGRVLVEAPGHFLASTPYCKGNTTLGGCYFLPLTNCTVTAEELAAAPFLGQEQYHQLLGRDPKLPRVVRIIGDTPWVFVPEPLVFASHLSTTAIPTGGGHRIWWWRAITSAYIVRPNDQTKGELATRRRTKVVGGELTGNCIGLYIRHGDKHRENEIYSNEQYEMAVKKLRSIDGRLTKKLFLSTEDGETVAYFRNSSRGWSTTYVDMPMKNDPNKTNLEYMAQHGFHEEMLNGLLNLQLILECGGFVGSIVSNWTRLIEELRSTVWCKAHAVYLDVKYLAPMGLNYVM